MARHGRRCRCGRFADVDSGLCQHCESWNTSLVTSQAANRNLRDAARNDKDLIDRLRQKIDLKDSDITAKQGALDLAHSMIENQRQEFDRFEVKTSQAIGLLIVILGISIAVNLVQLFTGN